MNYTVGKIAEIIDGKVKGDTAVKIHMVSPIEQAEAGSLSFLANPKYAGFLKSTKASALIISEEMVSESSGDYELILVEDPYTALAKFLKHHYHNKFQKSGIADTVKMGQNPVYGQEFYAGDYVVIGDNFVAGPNVKVFPQCYIGNNVRFGKNIRIFPGVKIYDDTIIGDDCTIHSGAVIGSDGFGFAPQMEKDYLKVAQIGNVVIEDDVEIGANTTIDRATLGSTIIKKGVKLDNLIQIAHNVEIGENTVIAAQTGISGSTRVGKNCMFGGQVGIAGHLSIADEVKIGAQSGISGNLKKKGQIVLGSPAFEISKYRRSFIHFRNLSSIVERLEELEKDR